MYCWMIETNMDIIVKFVSISHNQRLTDKKVFRLTKRDIKSGGLIWWELSYLWGIYWNCMAIYIFFPIFDGSLYA